MNDALAMKAKKLARPSPPMKVSPRKRGSRNRVAKLDRTVAKLKRYRIHDLRHTYASRLLARGANVKFIQQQLGHASLKMTLDTYSHLLKGEHEGLVTILDGSAQVTQGSPANDGASEGEAVAQSA